MRTSGAYRLMIYKTDRISANRIELLGEDWYDLTISCLSPYSEFTRALAFSSLMTLPSLDA